jgi:hypothetical protein
MTAPDLDALVARINALAECSYWANAGWDIPGDATQVIGRLAADPMNVGWQHAQNAIKDRAAAVSQWKAAKQRAERAEEEVARLTETTTHITWDAQGRRLVNGRFGHEHSAPTVNVQLSGDAEYWKERAERAEQERDEWKILSAADRVAAERAEARIADLERERDELQTAKEFEASHPQGLFSLLNRAYEQRDALAKDAERYRFMRSPLAGEYGIVQSEFWEELSFKLCREEKMDELVDGAMKLLRHHIDAAMNGRK